MMDTLCLRSGRKKRSDLKTKFTKRELFVVVGLLFESLQFEDENSQSVFECALQCLTFLLKVCDRHALGDEKAIEMQPTANTARATQK